jgi:hypothetical protein
MTSLLQWSCPRGRRAPSAAALPAARRLACFVIAGAPRGGPRGGRGGGAGTKRR